MFFIIILPTCFLSPSLLEFRFLNVGFSGGLLFSSASPPLSYFSSLSFCSTPGTWKRLTHYNTLTHLFNKSLSTSCVSDNIQGPKHVASEEKKKKQNYRY